MQEPNDHELLAQFTQQNSEAAFAALVSRHVNLVYSVALRKTGRPDAAEEIAQATFIILARKARGLPPRTILAGWLCETARLTAANYLRTEIRRQKREQEAHVQSILNEPPAEDLWKQITPLLDDALAKLGTPERNAVVLRFFENKNLRDVGAALGVSEDAAKRRVHRALEKLRKIFLKRGVTLSTLALGGMLTANSVQAAPVALAAAAVAAQGTAISTTIMNLVNATMKTMAWLKFKFAAGVGVAALLAGGATTIIISESGGAPTVAISQSGGTTTVPQTGGDDSTWTPQEIAKQSQDTYAALTSYSDTGTAVLEFGGQPITTTFNLRLQRPNLYRIQWTQTSNVKVHILNTNPGSNLLYGMDVHGIVWSDGSGDFLLMEEPGKEGNAQPEKEGDMRMALGLAMGVSGQASAIVPETFFKLNLGDVLGVAATGYSQMEKQKDESISGIDCHVFSSKLDPAKKAAWDKAAWANSPRNKTNFTTAATTTIFWIGKRDHLIHKARQTWDGFMMTWPELKKTEGKVFVHTETHENIVVNEKFTPADFAR